MYRLFDLHSLATTIADDLATVVRALHDRSPGDVLVDVLGDLDGERHYLPLVDLDVRYSAPSLLPHVS